MKRLSLLLLVGLLAGTWAHGAGEGAARAAADREAAEERYRILSSSLDDLLSAQLQLKQRLDAVTEAIQRVSAEVRSKPGGAQVVSREEFDRLVETVREIDRKREADRRQILAQIEELGEKLLGLIPRSASSSEPNLPKAAPAPRGDQQGVEYVVERGNTLSAIISAHNAEFKGQGLKTSLQLILDANAGLEPKTMQVGRKLFIPMVPIQP